MKVYAVLGKDNELIAKEVQELVRKLRIGEQVNIKRVG